jgi:predicted Zn-dependent protease
VFRFIVPLTLALALSAQDQPPRATGAGINFFNLDREIALGAQLAEATRRNTKALDNAAVQQYAARLGGRLSSQAGGPNFTYTFTVVADRVGGRTHEPLALPGGPIFIPADLIVEARSEAELAGMLAHAIGHVADRHYTRRMTREDLMQIGAVAAAKANPQPNVTRQVSAINSQADTQLRRTFELQADRLAVQAMAKAGYDPAALIGYIRRTQPVNDDVASSPMPPVELRLSAIEAVIATLPARAYTSSGEFEAIQREVRK